MSVFLVQVANSDEDFPYRLRHKGLKSSQLKELEKKWDIRLSKCQLKGVETFCRKHRIFFRSVPKSYFRIPKSRNWTRVQTDKKLWDMLYDYQKKGVSEILNRLGSRAILGDEMGCGKTIQGIAYISHRLNILPTSRLLIVCPSYLQIHWKTELTKFLQQDSDIWEKTECPDGRVVIIPYSKLCNRDVASVKWETIVADECHYIKTRTSKRTKAFVPLCHTSSGVLLMSGTPCVNRPNELYTQMHAVRPQHCLSYFKFAERFCDGRRTRFGWDDTGSSNPDELYWLLKKEYMVRRLKRDVLTELEPKMRYHVTLNVEWRRLERLEEIRSELKALTNSSHDMMKRKALISEAFRETAKAKAPQVSKWVNDRIENSEEPFIVFAHHQVTLDTLEQNLKTEDYIRIDGNVSKEKRQAYVERFQNGEVKVALLSIMAAGTGITMTKASVAIFAELYWVPGVILQAEDRIHRVGQTKPVSIIYLLGTGTIDLKIYPQVVYKLKVLDKAVDNRSDRSMETQSFDDDYFHELDITK